MLSLFQNSIRSLRYDDTPLGRGNMGVTESPPYFGYCVTMASRRSCIRLTTPSMQALVGFCLRLCANEHMGFGQAP